MRKEKTITITAEGRDKGKVFYIQEMPASQAEWWAIRAFQAVTRAGIDIPDNVKDAGMAGIAIMGLRGFAQLPPADLKDLMDEMFDCVKVVRDHGNPLLRFPPVETDIEEVETRLFLRGEIFELHTGFSLAGGKTNSNSPATASSTSNTQTSPEQSAQ